MSEFRPAFEFMMDHEDFHRTGVITGEPNGARARWGINSHAHPEVDLDAMTTIDQAADWYRINTWETGAFGAIGNQAVASKYYDMAINMGLAQATKIVQRALLAAGSAVLVTGHCDPQTMTAINALDSGLMLYHIREQASAFYRSLAEKKPDVYGRFLAGWLRRATC